MKRKVVSSGRLRLSPNEEAFVLKEDYERRRKLRLLQVREQERGIAFQIREDIKRRRNQQFARLAEELRADWAESQTQKIKKLEKLYLASLRTLGEGHQQATVHAPDLNALEQQAAERKLKAEIRHKEALKVQKDQKKQLMKQKTWHLQARKDALLVEKERSARVTRLPPPPPPLFENIDLSRIPPVKPSCASYHHLSSLVNREMDPEQPDAHLAAEEEAKRLEDAERQASRERAERCEKAHIRGSRALTRIRLAQNQEKLLRELKQLQQEDLARRRQTVAQMPAQLVELPYRRSEMKEEWQRELEFAFEDMYNAGKKVEGNLVLHLEPEPVVADPIRDEDLDLSMEQELPGDATSPAVVDVDVPSTSDADVKPQPVPSKLLYKKLLSKIRNQKSLWTVQSVCEEEGSLSTCVEGSSSQEPSAETEVSAATESETTTTTATDTATDSGPLPESLPACEAEPVKETGIPEVQPVPDMATESVESVLLHPQEAATKVRMAARRRQIMEIEEQKQKQLELLERIEQQKLRLESDRFRAQLEEKRTAALRAEDGSTSTPSSRVAEDSHRQTIRSYQRHLLQQNRLHRQAVQAARKQLLEFQSVLRGTHLGPGMAGLAPGLHPGLRTGESTQGLLLGRAASTDTPSTSMLLAQTPQAAVRPRGPDIVPTSSPGPHQASSYHALPASHSTSGEASAQPRGAPSLLTCSSWPVASGVTSLSLDTGATQRDLLQLLQEQLDVQREALQSQEAQEPLKPGACFPLHPLGFSAPLLPASEGPGWFPESSPLEGDPGMFSDHAGDPQPVWVPGQAAPGAGEQEADPLTLPPAMDSLPAELPEASLCPPSGPARPLSILNQFLPLHNCLKLLQAQLATQWEALAARHDAQAQLLARRPWDPGHSLAGHGSFAQVSGPCSPTQERHLPPGPQQEELCLAPFGHTHRLQRGLGVEPETQGWSQGPGGAVGGPPGQASPPCTLSQVMTPEGAQIPPFQEELDRGSQPVPPARDSAQGGRETLDSGDVPVQGQKIPESLPSEPARPQEPSAEPDPGHVQALELQARLQRLSRLLQPQCGQLQALQERLVAQRAALTCTGEAPAAVPSAHPLPPDRSGLAALQQQLDSQKKALRARQAAQEGLLLQRLQELERRVCAPWAAGARGSPSPSPARSLLNGSGLTAPQGPRPHDLLSGRPTEPCPLLPLASTKGGSTDPSNASQLWGQQREGQKEMQGQQASQEALDTGPTCAPPECPGVLDVAAEGQLLSEPLTSPSLLAPATVPVASLLPEPLHRVAPRPPRPPVARVQSGLELQQHELSLIPEGESPTPSDFCQDRDPLRVSVSREQSLLGDVPARPVSARPPLVHVSAAGAVMGQEPEQPAAVLSCTVEAAQTRHSPALEPAQMEVQETYHEPLSITISTGSFLSFENPDLSLTDSESFSDNVGPGLLAEAEACLGLAPLTAYPRADPLDMAALVLQRADVHQEDTSSTAQTLTPPEPEPTFPDVSHQQFKPLEAHLDLDVSPLPCGLNLSQVSEHSRENCSSVPSPTSSSSGTSLRVRPHPLLTTGSAWPPAPAPAYTTASCLTDHAEGSQQDFLHLLPELSSPESQQADLPSILSIEAGDRPGCLDHLDPSERLEQSPKNVHFQFPVGTALGLAMPSPGEACALHSLLLPPNQTLLGMPLSGTASELSVELHRGATEVSPVAPPLPPTQTGTPNRLAGPELSVSSGSFSSRSLIPIWETESGRGIMEEPDLTLVSLSDVSIETDFSTLSLEEKENKAQSSFQASPCPHAAGHCAIEAAEHSPQLSESLQGASVERNQPFMRCSQRQKQLQNKTQACENSQSKVLREKPGGSGSYLKSMSRVPASIEDQRPFTHQRALRLYNHTVPEVKQQKEEKARQDAYAQNRARAKEFHKKTLEKLRAKNTY
ncbi:centrosomal protein of 295 kDa [Sorex araneus]|uniref:centrosomal protein of 295 kDa n=1 Tax=Sorex araneus TaxID=42254 RepID=UPI0024339A2A|nr:centrosomal protein of 295 kDa [Sorex araneus]XP_054986071.1 centrosomal protein of 295 kDa [Sorex araneus]